MTSTRTIIAGSRSVTDIRIMQDAIDYAQGTLGWDIRTVLSGGARGVDRLGEQVAGQRGLEVEVHLADWDTEGRSAGYRRNERMAERADALIAVWDGESRGTKHMIDIARRRGLQVLVWSPTQEDSR